MDERRIARRPQCVLVVDDMADVREPWTAWLTIWGFRPVDAVDGRDALVKAAAHQPSVILMDLWMSMLDGTAAIQQLKRHPATAHIPVIALTAHAYAPAHARALAVEAARVVVKPCEANVLLEHIRAAMRRPITQYEADRDGQRTAGIAVGIAVTPIAAAAPAGRMSDVSSAPGYL